MSSHVTEPWSCLMCGATHASNPEAPWDREGNHCARCRASTRCRAMAQAVLAALGPLSGDPGSTEPRIAGISDNPVLSEWLSSIGSYTGYHFGAEPHLDLCAVPDHLVAAHEIVTCSDVLEHVVPPVSKAFHGLRQVLRPGGFAVLSVPCAIEGGGEHFPELNEWHVEGDGDDRVLVNRRTDGSVEVHDDLVWHGGDGFTLEMRLFDREWFRRELVAAGFVDIVELRRNWPRLGVAWEDWSRVWMARSPG